MPGIYAVHETAISLLASLSRHDNHWWNEPIEFTTRSAGTIRSPRRIMLMHSIRH